MTQNEKISISVLSHNFWTNKNLLEFRPVKHVIITVWTSVLWKMNIHISKKWPELVVTRSFIKGHSFPISLYVSGNKWMLFNYSNSALQSDNDYFKLIATFQSSKGVDEKKNSQQPWEVESSLACFFVVHFQFRIIWCHSEPLQVSWTFFVSFSIHI